MLRAKTVAAACAAAVLSGLVVAAPTTAQTPTPTAQPPAVQWSPCPNDDESLKGLDCATVTVPMDYRRSSGTKLSIAISRHRATDPKHRRGILFTNPGGPGSDGLWVPNAYAPQPLSAVYDVIGMDPRGTGRSTPLHCAPPSHKPPRLSSRPTEQQLADFATSAKEEEHDCAAGGGQLRQFVTTMNMARDMDTIRAALGEKKINFVGVSYGTFLGAMYGQMFPQHMDRNVLDSALNPDRPLHDQRWDAVAGIRRNYDAWARWAAQRNKDFGMGATPQAVRSWLERIATIITTHPEQPTGFSDITDLDEFVGDLARYRPMWYFMADRLRFAIDTGSQHTVAVADIQQATTMLRKLDANDSSDTGFAVYDATTCEWAWPGDVNTYYGDMRKARDTFPYGNSVGLLGPTNCTFRSFTPEPLLHVGKARYKAGLVLQADGDTQTPYPSGVAMARTLGSHLITVANEGIHAQFANQPGTENNYPLPNKCVDDAVNAYLLKGTLPKGNIVCQSVNLPPGDTATGGQQARIGFDSSAANSEALSFLAAVSARRFR